MQARSNWALVAIRRFMIDREDSHGACRDQGRYGTPYSILEPVRIAEILPESCHGVVPSVVARIQRFLNPGPADIMSDVWPQITRTFHLGRACQGRPDRR